MKKSQTRITVRISASLLALLDVQLKDLHLRRDAYLNYTLGAEVDELEKLPANSAGAQRLLRQLRGAIPDKARFAITLDTDLVERINAACKSKGIVRDAFIESYIRFLTQGDIEGDSCISPLVKAADFLRNPRREYSYSTPPYIDLYWSEEDMASAANPIDLKTLFREASDEHKAR